MKISMLAAILLTGGISASAPAQKLPVFINATTQNDGLSAQYVYEIKEAIRASNGFRLVENEKQWPYIRYVIVTFVPSGVSYIASAHSFSFDNVGIPLGGASITTAVEYCPGSQVSSCARVRMGALDAAATHLRDQAPELWKTLQ